MRSATEDLLNMVAQGMLRSWYITWERCSNDRHPPVRRAALMAKAGGLVHHDRVLNREVRHG